MMNRSTAFSVVSASVLGGCLIVLVMFGFGPETKAEIQESNGPAKTLSFQPVPDKAVLNHARLEASRMSGAELETALTDLLDRIQAVEQWAGFIHAYELQLRESEPAKFREWDALSNDSASLLFITMNMTSYGIIEDLKNPELDRQFTIENYAQNLALIEQTEAFRLRLSKSAMINLFGLKSDDVLLEAWD